MPWKSSRARLYVVLNLPLLGEGAGEEVIHPAVAVEIGIEDDVLAVGGLEALLGLESHAQGVGGDELGIRQVLCCFSPAEEQRRRGKLRKLRESS